SMMTPSALVKLANTWINNGRRFGPSETLRGLRNARRTSRRPVRRTRYASGITRCIVRSILSAIVETSSVMMIFGCESYAKARRDAMQCGPDWRACAARINYPLRRSTFANARRTSRTLEHYRLENLQHLIPFALVFEHDLPEETNGRHAVAEQFVMKFLQREIVALLRLVVVAQFQDLQFAKGVIQITRIKRSAHGFLARWLRFVVTVVLKKSRRFINRHVLRVHLDGHT